LLRFSESRRPPKFPPRWPARVSAVSRMTGDVRVLEGFLDRLFYKTGTLVINTAGTSTHEVILKHIETPYEVKKKLDGIRE